MPPHPPIWRAPAGRRRQATSPATTACATPTARSPRAGASAATVRIAGNLEANNGDALRAAALAGLGIVYLPDFIAAADIAAGGLVRLLPDWETPSLPIHAVFPPQRHPSAKLRAFIDFLAARFADGGSWAQACRVAAPAGRG